jgi:hypothetical protein
MWRDEYFLIVLVGVFHVILASICIRDLFTVSQRSNKMRWLIFLAMLPFISVYFYRSSMKRKRQFDF